MRKLLIAAVVALGTVACAPANAGLFDTMATSGWPEVKPSVRYKLSTYGYDVRVYEWIPKDNKNVRCVFVAGSKSATGVACYSTVNKGK